MPQPESNKSATGNSTFFIFNDLRTKTARIQSEREPSRRREWVSRQFKAENGPTTAALPRPLLSEFLRVLRTRLTNHTVTKTELQSVKHSPIVTGARLRALGYNPANFCQPRVSDCPLVCTRGIMPSFAEIAGYRLVAK